MTKDFTKRALRVRNLSFVAGCIALVLCIVGYALSPRQLFISYLTAWMFWIGLSLGCLGVAMIHSLTGGKWGFVSRRIIEAGFMVLPVMIILFIPLLAGLRELYPWARPADVAANAVLGGRGMYMNVPFFCVRSACYFAIWLAMALALRKWSLQQDSAADVEPTIRMRALSGIGIVIYPLTATFACIDWIMSIEPAWYSTIFPVIVIIGQILSAFSLVALVLARLHQQPPFSLVATRQHFHDFGNLLLAFVIFWTYVSYSQLLIMYSGNLPREIDWYLHRIAGGWQWIVGALALFHFFVPFFLLLFRVMKQSIRRLAGIAILMFSMHVVEVYWVIQPSFFPHGIHIHWLDFTAVIGLGGIWFAGFIHQFLAHEPLPQNDPRIEFSLAPAADAK